MLLWCPYRDAGAAEQIITVQRLDLPPPEQRLRASQYLDVMEVSKWARRRAIVDSIIFCESQIRNWTVIFLTCLYYARKRPVEL